MAAKNVSNAANSARASSKVEKVISRKNNDGKINIKLTMNRDKSRSPLYNKYNIQQYDLHPGYHFNEIADLIPSGVAEYVDDGSRYVERIVRALYLFKQCALIGPTGTGKTHIIYLIADLFEMPVWEVNCALQTSSYDLIGRYVNLGKENWIDGQVILWLKHGGILYLDEANLMRQDVVSRLNPVFDTRRHLVLVEKDNEIIQRHKYAYCIISINPYSLSYVGTKKLNASFKRRMSVWINFSYQSIGNTISDKEVELIMKFSNVNEDLANKILRVGAELRMQYLRGDLPYGPSPRDLINWAMICNYDTEPKIAAEETIVSLVSQDIEIQDEVRGIISRVFS